MDRTITIDHAYDQITLQFTRSAKRALSPSQWSILCNVDKAMQSTAREIMYTDVVPREEAHLASDLWSRAEDHIQEDEYLTGSLEFEYECARRTIMALGIIAFGTGWALKSG